LAALMGIEGGHSMQNDVRLLREYYRLGIRYMTLSWMNTNDWADSSGDIDNLKVRHHNGLTDFGRQVVLEMNRLGMLVDISHVADKTFYDVLAITKAPVIASHSSCRAIANHPRNMTDDMLRALAKNGGVVMINYHAAFLSEEFRVAKILGYQSLKRFELAEAAAGDICAVTGMQDLTVGETITEIARPPRSGATPSPASRIAPSTATMKADASERKKFSAPMAMPTWWWRNSTT